MQWLTSHGPFWEDSRKHDGSDWFERNGEVVTDTALGEAAYCRLHGVDRSLVSMNPSSWLFSPVSVDYRENGTSKNIDIPNYGDEDALRAALKAAPAPLESWEDLEEAARKRFERLMFSPGSFESLRGYPFGKGAAGRLQDRLAVLNDFAGCFDNQGKRTPDGHRIYKERFTGDKSWFSDSSLTEKSKFEQELTFPHPAKVGEFLFCTWHGKVKSPQLRIHFSWPVRAGEPLFVVYVGPKITKR